MTDPGAGPGPARTSWLPANIVLIVVALALVAASVLWFRDSASASRDDARTQRLSRDYAEVTKAATSEALAFLTVDYTKMDPLIAEVLAGATGSFKRQYDGAKADLLASTRASKVVSSGTVLSVGIGKIDAGRAVVLVAADARVQNRSTRSKVQHYRIRLGLTRQGGHWLTSDLGFVG